MADFFKFPATVHLVASPSVSRADKIMSTAELNAFLKNDLIVEEKLDGANIGISCDSEGNLRVQNRGSFLSEPFRGQFSRLSSWIAVNSEGLKRALKQKVILFGEWCAAKHSIEYSSLPDLFFLFDVYDLKEMRFWSVSRRDALAAAVGLQTVPKVDIPIVSLPQLTEDLERRSSNYSNEPMEGFVLRSDDRLWNIERAKLVRQDFTQSIEEHWSKRKLVWNKTSGS